MLKNLNTKTIILASQSPRRQDLLSDLGITFEVITNFHRTHAFIDNSVKQVDSKLNELAKQGKKIDSLIKFENDGKFFLNGNTRHHSFILTINMIKIKFFTI